MGIGMSDLTIATDYWPSAAAFAVFAALHSLGAQDGFKERIARLIGRFAVDHFWRLSYCVASYVLLYQVVGRLHWDLHPDANVWLIDYPEWLWRVLITLHLGSIAMIYGAFVQSDYLEFWGIKQAWRGVLMLLGRTPPATGNALFGSERLEIAGLYAWVRHPMLAGGLLFLLTSGPSRNNLVFTLLYLLYMLAGGYYEERRLLRVFGERYAAYRREVGAFVPRLRLGARALR